jgi:hypothetical protein
MSWIVDESVTETWQSVGHYCALEWPRFIDDVGLRVCWAAELPDMLSALIAGRTVIVRPGLDEWTTARLVWHEVGHSVLHVGDYRDWEAMTCGDLILAKFESQADEFARRYPDWECQTEGV